MAKLIHSVAGAVIREFALDQESVTLGRKAHNDIQIESAIASSEHARIVTLANDSFLEDLASTNGTRVNGTPVSRHVLRNNDVIEIGNHSLLFVSDADGVADNDFEKTIVLGAPPAALRAPPPKQGFFAKLMSWFK